MSTTITIGQVIKDQYRVDAFISSGGMANVFRVWDLKRNVPLAMKVLHADLVNNETAYRSFLHEANALRKLSHPNIIPFYGIDRTGDFDFILAGFVEGTTLKQTLRRQAGFPMDIQETLIYLKAISAALGYAHNNGIVHCDVKPGNVMVDAGGNIYLTDFGIARHADSTTTTLAGVGTPAYMAPEQILGQTLSAATDIYSLGIMLFEMLTGQRPFKGESDTGSNRSWDEHYTARLTQPPPDPCRINPNLPEALGAVLQKALNTDPQQRYADTQTLFYQVCAAVGFQPGIVPDRLPPTQTKGDSASRSIENQLASHSFAKDPIVIPIPEQSIQLTHTPQTNDAEYPYIGMLLLNKYRIEQPIEESPLGGTYIATHLEQDRLVIVRLLRKIGSGADYQVFRQMQGSLEKEARLTAQLDHQHIVDVSEIEEDENFLLLSKEYPQFGTLADYLNQNRQAQTPIPIDTAVKLTGEIALGLGELHSRNIVHRDLRPENVFLVDNQGTAKITGLGYAQVLGTPSHPYQTDPLKMEPPGSAEYMSPEQSNNVQMLKPPSDVFTLGVILFEMLTGQNYNLMPPGTRAAQIRKDTPKWLDQLLVKMLSLQPERRPWSGTEVYQLLQRSGRGTTPVVQDETGRRRKPWMVIVPVFILVAAAAAFFLTEGKNLFLPAAPTAIQISPTYPLGATPKPTGKAVLSKPGAAIATPVSPTTTASYTPMTSTKTPTLRPGSTTQLPQATNTPTWTLRPPTRTYTPTATDKPVEQTIYTPTPTRTLLPTPTKTNTPTPTIYFPPTPTKTFTPTTPPPTLPAAPSNISVSVDNTGCGNDCVYIDISWNDNSTNEDGFEVSACDPWYNCDSWTLGPDVTDIRLTFTGICDIEETFSVFAFNDYGTSPVIETTVYIPCP